MPNPSTPCGRAIPQTAVWGAACGCLLPPWIPLPVGACPLITELTCCFCLLLLRVDIYGDLERDREKGRLAGGRSREGERRRSRDLWMDG
jgi:hypothetical protein